MEQTHSKKKTIAIVAVVACLALAAALGTYAWLTAQGSLTNNFTTAGINNPTTDPDDPSQPLPTDKTKVDGNLTETKWTDNAKLVPGESVNKNPNVGLGKGSENAYVYVYVKNETASGTASDANTTYFTIDTTKWAAVDGQTTSVTVAGEPTHYLGGLFVYTGAADSTDAGILTASADKDVWTGELFSKVTTPVTANTSDFAKPAQMLVNSYVYAAKNGATENEAGSAAAARTGAIEWASKIANGNN